LQQPRHALWRVLDQDLAAAVQQEAVQRRLLVVLGDGSAGFVRSACATGEDIDGIAREVLEQKPGQEERLASGH
jgi:hypothetical protein